MGAGATQGRRENAAGFMRGGRFIPIRSGVVWPKAKPGQKRPKPRDAATPYFWPGDFEPRDRRLKTEGMTLSQFVRSDGGIKYRPDADLAGEMRRVRETGARGLVFEGGKMSPEHAATNAREAGFKVPRNPAEFLAVLEADASGHKIVRHPEWHEQQAEREYMSRNPEKNLFGLGRKKRKRKKGAGLVGRVAAAVRGSGTERRKRQLEQRRLELSEAQLRRREWEKEQREREQRERKARREQEAERRAAERAEKARQKALLQEQAYRQRMAKQEQRAREAMLAERKGSRRRQPRYGYDAGAGRRGRFFVSEREMQEGHEAVLRGAANPKGKKSAPAKRNPAKRSVPAKSPAARNPIVSVAQSAYPARPWKLIDGQGRTLGKKHPSGRGQIPYTFKTAEAALKKAAQLAARQSNPTRGGALITPKTAKALLKANVGNRPVDQKKVAAIAGLMKRGIYNTTQPIIFTNGLLTDGQHRLLAVVKAGVPVRMKLQRKTLKTPNPAGLAAKAAGGVAGGVLGAIGWTVAQPLIRAGAKMVKKIRAKNPKPQRNSARAANGTPKAPARVVKMRETFNGEVKGRAENLYTPPGTPEHVTELGRLEYVVLANGKRWAFRSNPATLGGSGGETIQRLHIGLKVPYRTPNGHKAGEAIDYGPVAELGYRAPKPHLYPGHRTANGKPKVIRFYHGLGEVNGIMPSLVLQNGRLRFKGGDYRIRREGIVN